MPRRRNTTTFNLSFLDVMSCGFGAVVLIFLIVNHSDSTKSNKVFSEEASEVRLLEEDIQNEEELLAKARNAQEMVSLDIVEVSGRASKLLEELNDLKEELAEDDHESLAKVDHINALKTEIQTLEEELNRLKSEGASGQGDRARFIKGDGERQYLTGMRLAGERTLVLLDSSASMLDRTIVNVVRLRNLPEQQRRQAPKWQDTVNMLEWILAQLPNDSEYQVYSFNTQTNAVLATSEGGWLNVGDQAMMDDLMDEVRLLVPQNGTSLINAFAEVNSFVTPPDNIVLITDGLPTQGKRLSTGKVNSRKRFDLFLKARKQLPANIPVNVILSPMEGDPLAPAAYWGLAVQSRGSFISPAKGWP